MIVLKKRIYFQRAAASPHRAAARGLVLQAVPLEGLHTPAVGYTASKKTIGNAVKRNFAKRRLRHLARELLSQKGRPGIGYVLIARPACLDRPFAMLQKDLTWALATVHKGF